MLTQIQTFAQLHFIPSPSQPPTRLRRRIFLFSAHRRLPLRHHHNMFSISSPALRITDCISSRVNDKIGSVGGEAMGEEKENASKQVRRAYPFHEIEPKWQRYWENNKTFRTPDAIDTSKPKFYVLDMFPYPRSSIFFLIVLSVCATD